MAFEWDNESIRWFLDASRYTDFHRRLAGYLAPGLSPSDTVCDLGCGLGRVDLALAGHVRAVTAVDIDARVLAVLRRDAGLAGIQNLEALHMDSRDMGRQYDVVLMSFYGSRQVEHAVSLCRRRLIWIVNADNGGNLYPAGHRTARKTTTAVACGLLDAHGLQYNAEEIVIEFGQPFRSFERGAAFVRRHAPHARDTEIRAFLRERLVRTGEGAFPFYLPNPKKIGIIQADAAPDRPQFVAMLARKEGVIT